MRVDDNVDRRVMAPRDQTLADEQSRNPISQSDLDRPGGALVQDPVPQVLALGGAGCNGKEYVFRAVRLGGGSTATSEPFDHLADLLLPPFHDNILPQDQRRVASR